jgi:uncharacterized damage-inducible protein DinB
MAEAMTPDQAVFLLQNVYMGPLKIESRTTKKILEAVPAAKADYRPDPISKSAIELVRHVAASDNRFVEAVINGVFDTNPAMIPENVKTPAEIAAWYEQRFAKNYQALTTISGEHHRGQLSSYLRCMGAKVPSIYGESYDDAQARKAAQA